MKRILKKVSTITLSKHFCERVKLRGIDKTEIIDNLKDPCRLISVEDQGEDLRGHKYALLFKKSKKYDLKVVISIRDRNLNVITSHIQNIKRRRVYKKWLEKLR